MTQLEHELPEELKTLLTNFREEHAEDYDFIVESLKPASSQDLYENFQAGIADITKDFIAGSVDQSKLIAAGTILQVILQRKDEWTKKAIANFKLNSLTEGTVQ